MIGKTNDAKVGRPCEFPDEDPLPESFVAVKTISRWRPWLAADAGPRWHSDGQKGRFANRPYNYTVSFQGARYSRANSFLASEFPCTSRWLATSQTIRSLLR